MEKKLNGIALLLFAILFYLCSDVYQAHLYYWRIGVAVPWAIITSLIGIVGLVMVFCKNKEK